MTLYIGINIKKARKTVKRAKKSACSGLKLGFYKK